jgi:hypothetical protein
MLEVVPLEKVVVEEEMVGTIPRQVVQWANTRLQTFLLLILLILLSVLTLHHL